MGRSFLIIIARRPCLQRATYLGRGGAEARPSIGLCQTDALGRAHNTDQARQSDTFQLVDFLVDGAVRGDADPEPTTPQLGEYRSTVGEGPPLISVGFEVHAEEVVGASSPSGTGRPSMGRRGGDGVARRR